MQKKKTIAMKKVARRKYDLGSKGGGITLLLLWLLHSCAKPSRHTSTSPACARVAGAASEAAPSKAPAGGGRLARKKERSLIPSRDAHTN